MRLNLWTGVISLVCVCKCDSVELMPYIQHEAGIKMMLHLKDAAKQGWKSTLLRTADTDAVALTADDFGQLNINKLLVGNSF